MSEFPMNVVDTLHTRLDTLMADHTVLDRSLRYTDPAKSLGIVVVDWTPKQDSHQIGQIEPVLATYSFRIMNLVKHGNEEHGKAWFALDSKMIRVILYRDATLRVQLQGLTENQLGTQEVAKRWGVGRQRFLSNELRGQFVFLALTDFWLETESVEL